MIFNDRGPMKKNQKIITMAFSLIFLNFNGLAQENSKNKDFCLNIRENLQENIFSEEIKDYQNFLKIKFFEINEKDNSYSPFALRGELSSFKDHYKALKDYQYSTQNNLIAIDVSKLFEEVKLSYLKLIPNFKLKNEQKVLTIIKNISLFQFQDALELIEKEPTLKKTYLSGFKGCGLTLANLNAGSSTQIFLDDQKGDVVTICPSYQKFGELFGHDIDASIFIKSVFAHEIAHSFDLKSKLINYEKVEKCLGKITLNLSTGKTSLPEETYNEATADMWASLINGELYSKAISDGVSSEKLQKTYRLIVQKYLDKKSGKQHLPGHLRAYEVFLANEKISSALGCQQPRTRFNCQLVDLIK